MEDLIGAGNEALLVASAQLAPLEKPDEEGLAEVSEKGVRLIDEKPRKGAEGLNIAFLHPKSTCGILTELCEHPE